MIGYLFSFKVKRSRQTCILTTYSNLFMTGRFFTKLKAKENKQKRPYMNVDQMHMGQSLKRSLKKFKKYWTICSHLCM